MMNIIRERLLSLPSAPTQCHRTAHILLNAALCLVFSLAAGCQNIATNEELLESPRTDHPAYTLGPGDKLRVKIYEHDSLSGRFNVDDAGTVSMPLVGRVNVKDMTLPEVEQLVTKELLRSHIADPQVSIDLIELRPFCVLGEVRNPGCFNYIHGLTVSKAIAMAGGYTYRAEKDGLVITREDGRKVSGEHRSPVLTGDVIEVPERFF